MIGHQRLWVAATIIAVFVFVGFILSVPHTRDVGEVLSQQNGETEIPSVSLRDSFKKGLHTIIGSLQTPDACTVVTAEASADAGSIFVTLSTQRDAGVCLQVPTDVNFRATVSAPPGLPIVVTVNGAMATTTP